MIFLKRVNVPHPATGVKNRALVRLGAGKPKAIPRGTLNSISAKTRSPILAAERYIRDQAGQGKPVIRADLTRLGINAQTFNLIAKHLRDNYNFEIRRRFMKKRETKIVKLWKKSKKYI